MPDLLTHVLVGYAIGTALSVLYGWFDRGHVTLVMLGALSPDLAKVDLVVPAIVVSDLLGVPFRWSALHTVVGSVLAAALCVLLFAPEYRRTVLALVALGAASHHLLDLGLVTPTGESYAVFWPLTSVRLPAGDLYLSTDRWPALVAGTCAALARAVARRREHREGDATTAD
ncbi:metal-dependent hydrolase [Natrinema saccharevitans]|uniref:Metal-dependent hydrolase n=1 Tax=Natrinema saccharevitans TaxID=301967 RepID=A0A1S8AU26_9EURY|nr:metal-dependent hydrolase [Natrinema saccharevitans]OLZ40162.1 metal-dependent hydrolase [Natrinema saccharevitans]